MHRLDSPVLHRLQREAKRRIYRTNTVDTPDTIRWRLADNEARRIANIEVSDPAPGEGRLAWARRLQACVDSWRTIILRGS